MLDAVKIRGYDRPVPSAEEKLAAQAAVDKALLEEAKSYGIDPKAYARFVAARLKQKQDWFRAAELDSPAPPGHPLRDFGQSDRETVENANHQASIQQVLALVNGELSRSIVEPFTELSLNVRTAPSDESKVDAIFLTLFSRKATAREHDLWRKAQERGLTNYNELIQSLINTQQFMFIQ
jgi:hypothetical protein